MIQLENCIKYFILIEGFDDESERNSRSFLLEKLINKHRKQDETNMRNDICQNLRLVINTHHAKVNLL